MIFARIVVTCLSLPFTPRLVYLAKAGLLGQDWFARSRLICSTKAALLGQRWYTQPRLLYLTKASPLGLGQSARSKFFRSGRLICLTKAAHTRHRYSIKDVLILGIDTYTWLQVLVLSYRCSYLATGAWPRRYSYSAIGICTRPWLLSQGGTRTRSQILVLGHRCLAKEVLILDHRYSAKVTQPRRYSYPIIGTRSKFASSLVIDLIGSSRPGN